MMKPDNQLLPIADITYNHALLMASHQQQQQQQQQQRALATKQHHIASAPLKQSRVVHHQMDPTMGPGGYHCEDAFKLYHCCVCNVYSSNSLESMVQHVKLDRGRSREQEILIHVQGSTLCKLCSYRTDSKAEFRLHRKTKLHRQRLRRANHVKEGGPENLWKLMHVDFSNPVQVRCNACGYVATSLRKLRLHIKDHPRHDADARVFLFLDTMDSAIGAEVKSYHCSLCKVSERTKAHLAEHIHSLRHIRAVNYLKQHVEGELDLKKVFMIKEYKQVTEKMTNEDDRENKHLDNYNDMRASPDEKVKDGSIKNSDTSTLKQAILDHSASEPDSSQKHVDGAHCDMTKEVEQYPASLNNPVLHVGGTLGNVLDSHAEELLKKSPEEIDKDLPDETTSLPDDSDDNIEDGSETKEQQVLEDYINSQTTAEDSYNDPNRKYKCHRSKVAFTRQSYLKSHNKTLLHREGEKKSYPMEKYIDPDLPFKCEVCKESFAKKNILLVHYTSVSHKLKLSMKETNSVGISANQQKESVDAQLDNDCPSVERPDSAHPSKPHQAKSSDIPKSSSDATGASTSATTVTQASKLAETRPFPVAATSSTATNPSLNSSQSTFPLASDHNSIMQRTLGILPPTSLSPEAFIQHQQFAQLFAQSQYPPPPMLSLQASNSQNIIPSLSHSQRQKQMEKDESREKQPRPSLGHPETSASPVVQLNHSSSQRNPTPGQQMFKSRFPDFRLKPLMFRHLLERFGFDVVMQFNENSQRRPRKEADKKDEQAENGSQKSEQADRENQKIDLPEINRSVCQKCGKVFSSIWVLKAHQEETHKDIVPIQAVIEKFAKGFREDYERRNTAISDVDDATNMAEAPLPSSRGELSTSSLSTPATPDTSRPVMNAATPPVTSLRSQMPDEAFSLTANHMAAQLQFNQFLMSMGQGMGLPMHMNMNLPFPAAMNMRPPLIPLMMPPSVDPLMASAFGHPMMPGAAVDPNNVAAQQKLLQQQQQLSQQQKRSRTMINEDQLKILRSYYDVDTAPTEEQLLEMSEKSGLPVKVIKHWFRNTLFRERQRNRDSLYNFNNRPSTYLNVEKYVRTGEVQITRLNEEPNTSRNTQTLEVVKKESVRNSNENEEIPDMSEACVPETKK